MSLAVAPSAGNVDPRLSEAERLIEVTNQNHQLRNDLEGAKKNVNALQEQLNNIGEMLKSKAKNQTPEESVRELKNDYENLEVEKESINREKTIISDKLGEAENYI